MTQTLSTTSPIFPLLADPANYRRCQLDLREDEEKLAYWLDLFRRHFPSLLASYIKQEGDVESAQAQACVAEKEFFAFLDSASDWPKQNGPLDILAFCIAREDALRKAGIDDAYRETRRSENISALKLLPQLLGELDALPPIEQTARLIEGVFAGNIFDLGATDTLQLFNEGQVDFHQVRSRLKPRPWLFDDFDRWIFRQNDGRPPYQCALLFVDNAGTDIVLGMIPLARDLLRRGGRVILTANTTPSLNDITHDELVGLLRLIGTWDQVIGDAQKDGRLTTVASGNGLPLIDLACVSAELAQTVRDNDIDLVVLEGMGRAVESNLEARLTCDVLKIAMIKDLGVAQSLGGELYDLVFRYESADVS